MNLCGHATLASSHVIFNELKLETDFIPFYSEKSGALSVTRDADKFVLDFPGYSMNEIEQSDELAQAVGKVPLKTWESQ